MEDTWPFCEPQARATRTCPTQPLPPSPPFPRTPVALASWLRDPSLVFMDRKLGPYEAKPEPRPPDPEPRVCPVSILPPGLHIPEQATQADNQELESGSPSQAAKLKGAPATEYQPPTEPQDAEAQRSSTCPRSHSREMTWDQMSGLLAQHETPCMEWPGQLELSAEAGASPAPCAGIRSVAGGEAERGGASSPPPVAGVRLP